MTKKYTLEITDNYKITDKLLKNQRVLDSNKQPDTSGVKGVVLEMYKDGKLIDRNVPNLVVVPGRRYNAQRITGKKHPDDPLNLVDFTLQHFGLGMGGSTISGDNPVLVGEDLCADDLHNPIELNSSYLTSPKGVDGVGKEMEEVNIKPNTHVDCTSPLNLTWVESICVKAEGEPLWLEAGQSVKIDEAMLYISDPDKTVIYPFAHSCFYPKWIEKESEFVLIWYTLC